MAFDAFATSVEFSTHPERDSRCVRHRVDDPLTQHLRGIKFPGLRPGVWLNNQTVNLFDEFRGQELEKLKSVFVDGQGLGGSVWVDISPTCSNMSDHIVRYGGLPLDNTTVRAMDIHNHPSGSPTSSFEDNESFLGDLDHRIQAIVSNSGTFLMVKKYQITDFDPEEHFKQFTSIAQKHIDDIDAQHKEYNLWLAKRYGLDLLWLPAGSKVVQKFK